MQITHAEIDPWFLENLVCPIDQYPLEYKSGRVVCYDSHEYPVFEGIPVMLLFSQSQTHKRAFSETINLIRSNESSLGNFSLEEPGVSAIDPFVQKYIGATNSNLYQPLVGRLTRYPIPELGIPSAGKDELFLDIGCNWGRWCIAAYRLGYIPTGIDPSLKAILAAYRVAKQLRVEAKYLVADSRFLPFRQNLFKIIYSYSVFQHFDKQDVKTSLIEIGRTLHPEGTSIIQMLNVFGLRSFYAQLKRGFKNADGFETRYWSPQELTSVFNESIGPSRLEVGSFFTQGQPSDKDMFPLKYRVILKVGEMIKLLNNRAHILTSFADNLLVLSEKRIVS